MCLGVPGQITHILDEALLLAVVDVGGVRRQVNVACIVDEGRTLEDCVGAWVLIHVGFAMSVIDAEEAAATLKTLEELGELQRELTALATLAPPGEGPPETGRDPIGGEETRAPSGPAVGANGARPGGGGS